MTTGDRNVERNDERDANATPVIGIPAALGTPSETGYVNQQVGAPYVRALEAAGAIPLVLPVIHDVALIRRLLSQVDGILLQGGGDIAPRFYDQDPLPALGSVNEETDVFELELCRQCVENDIPVLAICRGIQVLNVALGGTLIQDIPTECSGALTHRQKPPRDAPSHSIEIEPASRIASLIGETDLAVNSFHHQAIAELGCGLVATAWSEDRLIEAVEAPGKPFVVGVQFHPEETTRSVPPTAALFRGLVEAARARLQRDSDGRDSDGRDSDGGDSDGHDADAREGASATEDGECRS